MEEGFECRMRGGLANQGLEEGVGVAAVYRHVLGGGGADQAIGGDDFAGGFDDAAAVAGDFADRFQLHSWDGFLNEAEG